MDQVNYDNIAAARTRVSPYVATTPLQPSFFLESLTGLKVFLKLENLNLSGSFKIRGAANAILSNKELALKKGIVAASAGNHAQGVAYFARLIKADASIFMPKHTPLIKVESTKSLGAKLFLQGAFFDEAFAAAKEFQEKKGSIMVHPYADDDVICGQGTIGLELMEQLPDFATVIVPVGGGGLISGIACAVKSKRPDVKIIGVQTKAFPGMKLSFDAGKKVAVEQLSTIADGIAVKSVNEKNLALILKYVDDIVLVDEEEIASAVLNLVERNHLLTEGAGAVSVAALLKLKSSDKGNKIFGKKPVVCVLSGGNIDVNLLNRIISRGLIYSGRMMRLRFLIYDRPGSLFELLEVIGKAGANIIEIRHQRIFSSSKYNEVEVDTELETASPAHQEELIHALNKAKFKFTNVHT